MKHVVGDQQASRDPALRAAFLRVEETGRRRHVASMQDALGVFMRASGLTRRRGESPVYDAFDRAAGKDVARRARPVKFTRGTLTVEVDSAAHLHELEGFLGEKLRENANRVLGRQDIRRIAFRLKG